MSKRIAIIGGGLMGLATAFYLSKAGHRVTVFEKESQLGGLTTHHDYGPFIWDRFYHVILPTDSALTGFIREIGLGDLLRWRQTYTGFYVDETLYSMSSSLEFLKFPPVTLWGKFRLMLTILYCSRITNWRRLEKIPLEQWLLKWSGKHTYEKLWKPLLLAKLGENYQRVSAVFIWSYVKRMFSARDSSSASKEHMGHVSGGYKAVFDRVEKAIADGGGEIRRNISVEKILAVHDAGLTVKAESSEQQFDKVIFTGPVNLLRTVAQPSLLTIEDTGRQVEYLGVVCVVLITKKPLVPYYIVNIADPAIPFTGIVGMSNVVATDETSGLHITYLPKYVLWTDPFLRKPDSEIQSDFLQGLRRMFPEVESYGIEAVHVNRATVVQPLQVVDYSSLVPKVVTNHPDFFVLNTSQFANNTLNNNAVIKSVQDFIANYCDFSR